MNHYCNFVEALKEVPIGGYWEGGAPLQYQLANIPCLPAA